MIALEDIGNGNTDLRVLVRTLEPCAMIEVGATGQSQLSQ